MPVSVCVDAHMSASASDEQKRALDPWSWSYGQLVLGCPTWMLGTELPAPRVACNCCSISWAHLHVYLQTGQLCPKLIFSFTVLGNLFVTIYQHGELGFCSQPFPHSHKHVDCTLFRLPCVLKRVFPKLLLLWTRITALTASIVSFPTWSLSQSDSFTGFIHSFPKLKIVS